MVHGHRAAERSVVAHYNQHAASMQNLDFFYNGVRSVVQAYVAPTAGLCDVGCGTGALLAALRSVGYTRTSGTDVAQRCVDITKQRVPSAEVFVHDIEWGPLPTPYDAITLTTVIDFLARPTIALAHLRASLRPGGLAIITFRNRLAYWPWYHARGFARFLPGAWLRHWFLWFTTPLGMRRTDQPYEQVYSSAEARALLRQSGLRPVAEHGFQCLPMLWIPNLPGWLKALERVDRWSQRLPGTSRYFYYIFVCSADEA